MINADDRDKLEKTIQAIDINFQRLEYANSQVKDILPLSAHEYNSLNDSRISFIDPVLQG